MYCTKSIDTVPAIETNFPEDFVPFLVKCLYIKNVHLLGVEKKKGISRYVLTVVAISNGKSAAPVKCNSQIVTVKIKSI